VHAAFNELQRQMGTMLLGRRMYEVLVPWETMDTDGQPSVMADFAGLWRETDKVVYSRTLDDVSSARTRLERDFDPATIRRMKASATRDLSVGGPDLAAQAFAAGLVEECHVFLNPIVVGAGTNALPENVRVPLELLDERRFTAGVVHLHYRIQGSP
jgi:dihydrofolate reductase